MLPDQDPQILWWDWDRTTREAILTSYPYLETEDIDTAMPYAAFLAEDETVELSR